MIDIIAKHLIGFLVKLNQPRQAVEVSNTSSFYPSKSCKVFKIRMFTEQYKFENRLLYICFKKIGIKKYVSDIIS